MASHFFLPTGGHWFICLLISSNGNVHSRNSWLPTQQRLLGIFFHSVVRNDYLSTQWQLLGIFFCSVARNDYLSTQQWLPVDCLLMVGDILDHRTCEGGFQIWTTKGHPPNGGGDSVHVCYACSLIPLDAAGTHSGNPRSCYQSNGQGAHGCFQVHLH